MTIINALMEKESDHLCPVASLLLFMLNLCC